MTYDFKNYEKDTLTKPRNKAWSNWAKFEKEGDKVQGFIRDVFYCPAEKDGDGKILFHERLGLTLETPKGEFMNVGIKRLPFILAEIGSYRLGDPFTMVYEKTLAPKQKGYKGAKQFGYYGTNLPENSNNGTVTQLESEDIAFQKSIKGGLTVEAQEETEEGPSLDTI